MRWDSGVDTSDGRGDHSSLVTTGSTSATLTNDGRFSTRNPFGPYWGLLTPNTPIWLELDAGAGMYTVVQHFVNEWPTRWAPGALDCVTPIKCSGVLRRLQKGDALADPMERAIFAESGLLGYWRMYDPVGSTGFVSALPGGGPPMLAAMVEPDYAVVTQPPGGGEDLAARLNDSYVQTQVMNVAAPWSFEFSLRRPEDAVDDYPILYLSFLLDGVSTLLGVTAAPAADATTELWYHYYVTGEQVGSDAVISAWRNGEARPGVTYAGQTLGSLNRLSSNTQSALDDYSLAEVAVYSGTAADYATHSSALQAHVGEMAHERIIRECGYSGIPIQCSAAQSTVLGPQPTGTLIDVLRDAERADMGVLYEAGWGLGYQPLRDRYDAPVSMALDFDEGHVDGEPEPADDDATLVNRWKVTRDGGLFAVEEDETSRLGIQAGGPGLYADSVTVNVQSDDQLPHHARWRIHRDTLDEDRWPQIDFNFATIGGQALIPTWVTLGYGARITLDNPPPQVNQAQINLVIEGKRQFFNSLKWTASINASPASTYQVARYGTSPQYIRYDTRGSTLTADVSDSATSWSVTVASGYPLWVTTATHPDRFAPAGQPMYLLVGGVVYECTAIVGASSPQTFTVVRLATDKTHLAGAPIRVYQSPIYGL
jgi:hypothetical protein